MLGHGNPRQALASHVDEEDVMKLDTLTLGGNQKQNHVNESGLYALIFGSTKDEAKRFKRWVTHDVLPTLRKTGAYAIPQQAARLPVQVDILAKRIQARRAIYFDLPYHTPRLGQKNAPMAVLDRSRRYCVGMDNPAKHFLVREWR